MYKYEHRKNRGKAEAAYAGKDFKVDEIKRTC